MTLELRDISLRYSKKIVLQNLSIRFEGAKIHALLGENGAGKSTTANIICGELQPDSGELFLDDKPVIFANPKAAIEHGICYVHQTPMLADSISVRENLLLGIKKEYQKNIDPVTKMWIPTLNLATRVKELSGGMRFFIALCSALIKQPKLLLLDEPTALLDDTQKAFLFENLTTLAQNGMNIILITHNMDEAEKYCDTIDFLEEGKLAPKKPLPKLNAKNRNDKITLIQDLTDDGQATLEKKLINWIVSSDRKSCAIIPTNRK
ncbi:MAG: sugar ABC transporter ATP-binding protein, partial [Treponema sp.]|nr:sugar ABC transporter ATP-binding protein [Treponema sp.]